jgi:hypothetical protein
MQGGQLLSRRGAGAALAVAVAAGALAAPAVAGNATYAGKTDGGGKFAADVVIKKGKVKTIAAARAVNLPGECEQSGKQRLDIAAPEAIPVNEKGKFKYVFTQPEYGNVTTLKGKFDGKELVGTLDLNLHYLATDTLPEEDCSTGPLAFEGTKGATDQTQ